MEKTLVKCRTIERIQVVSRFRWYTFMLLNNKAHREERKYTNQLNLSHCGISNPHNIVQFYVFSPCSHFPSQNIFSSTPNKLLISVKGKKKYFFSCVFAQTVLCVPLLQTHLPTTFPSIKEWSQMPVPLRNLRTPILLILLQFMPLYIYICVYIYM